jgi:hypothetical protein
LEIIKNDLHYNAVRICGQDLERITTAAADALEQGLEVWISPELWGKSPTRTLAYLSEAAAGAERLRDRFPDRIVLSVASEATLLLKGIVPGRSLTKRVQHLFQAGGVDHYAEALDVFLAEAAATATCEFAGQLTYASLPFERVDWSIVGVDHYRDARIKGRYVERLQPLFAAGNPVVVTEFGMCSYRGDEDSGNLGFGIVDSTSRLLHSLPVTGRFVRPRLKRGPHIRDESLQAREIAETLRILDSAGVDGLQVPRRSIRAPASSVGRAGVVAISSR